MIWNGKGEIGSLNLFHYPSLSEIAWQRVATEQMCVDYMAFIEKTSVLLVVAIV